MTKILATDRQHPTAWQIAQWKKKHDGPWWIVPVYVGPSRGADCLFERYYIVSADSAREACEVSAAEERKRFIGDWSVVAEEADQI